MTSQALRQYALLGLLSSRSPRKRKGHFFARRRARKSCSGSSIAASNSRRRCKSGSDRSDHDHYDKDNRRLRSFAPRPRVEVAGTAKLPSSQTPRPHRQEGRFGLEVDLLPWPHRKRRGPVVVVSRSQHYLRSFFIREDPVAVVFLLVDPARPKKGLWYKVREHRTHPDGNAITHGFISTTRRVTLAAADPTSPPCSRAISARYGSKAPSAVAPA